MMAVTSAWMPGCCTVASAGAVEVAAAALVAADVAGVVAAVLVGARLAAGLKMLVGVTVLAEEFASGVLNDWSRLPNGLLEWSVPEAGDVGFWGPAVGVEDSGCRVIGDLVGSRARAVCIAILIRPPQWHFPHRFQVIENKSASAQRPVNFPPLRQFFAAPRNQIRFRE
jgi:hypothetical protein